MVFGNQTLNFWVPLRRKRKIHLESWFKHTGFQTPMLLLAAFWFLGLRGAQEASSEGSFWCDCGGLSLSNSIKIERNTENHWKSLWHHGPKHLQLCPSSLSWKNTGSWRVFVFIENKLVVLIITGTAKATESLLESCSWRLIFVAVLYFQVSVGNKPLLCGFAQHFLDIV